MLPVLQIGPLALQTSGLILLIGLWAALSLAERYASRWGIQPSILYNLAFVGLVFGVIGARLGYILRYSDVFAESPTSVISLNPGLLSLGDGLISACLASWVYGHRKGLPLWSTLDALTPALAVMAIAISLSQLASGSGFGMPTNLPWGIELWGARRHPSQIYETLTGLLILGIFWPGRSRFQSWPPGRYFLTFLATSAGFRLFLETLRADSVLLPGGFRTAQVIALLVISGSLWMLDRLERRKQIEKHP